ncbi:Transposon Ty3-I Gag-Pol polyprotein [Thelohanellus kitauei]|uniref:Transposon Ty3-I Gag-Pol polyprotein n=1 Tax=Thelohanellus kitauei TaxID=669202 RepID=A0A0C2MV29_THEKT|nr:Transposon Ty3-I Gag-Pol polyprotein [Thelohanellus kitauei]
MKSVKIPLNTANDIRANNLLIDSSIIFSRFISTCDNSCQVKEELKDLLNEFSDIFSVSEFDVGHYNGFEHKIITNDSEPIKQPYRRLPIHKINELRVLIDTLIDNGIIRHSQSSWSSPIVLVPKKDGGVRLCIDYRKLNSATVTDAYPIPRIDETLDRLHGSKWFSKLDLSCGYWQIPVLETDKHKTAFTTPIGFYEFNVLPFGLKNAPATFQRTMEYIFKTLNQASLLVYLDDLIIFSDNELNHLSALRETFSIIRKACLKVKPKKCEFFRTEINYLGFIVGKNGVMVDPEKAKIVKEWKTPKTPKQVQQFLGFCNYYRQFIRNYAMYEKPLRNLTKANNEFKWTQEHSNCFAKLKQMLTLPPILGLPDIKRTFVVDCDASDYALGSVLSQICDDGSEVVIQYASKCLNDTEYRYSTIRKELMAIVWSFKKFRPYLLGCKFLLRTDHLPLKSIQSSGKIGGQLARWLDLISEYDFEIKHREGIKHQNADCLSRYCSAIDDVKQCQELSNFTFSPNDIRTMQSDDPIIGVFLRDYFINNLSKAKVGEDPLICILLRQTKHLVVKNGILYRRYDSTKSQIFRLVVPRVMQPIIFKLCHDENGHMGYRSTLYAIVNRFYWPKLRADVKKYCDSCKKCNERDNPCPKIRAKLVENQCEDVFERVAMDILGPLPISKHGNKYIIVISDYFSRFIEAYPLANIDAKTVAKVFVDQFIFRYGIPKYLHTDQGACFESQLVKHVCETLGIIKTKTTAYHPQSDGLVERFNRTLINMLSKSINSFNEWEERLPALVFAYNTVKHTVTNVSPFELMFKRSPRLPIDASATIEMKYSEMWSNSQISKILNKVRLDQKKAQERQADFYNRKMNELETGKRDYVRVHYPVDEGGVTNKLSRLWRGPYKVINVEYPTLDVDINGKTVRIHQNRCKPSNPPVVEQTYQHDELQHETTEAEWISFPGRPKQAKQESIDGDNTNQGLRRSTRTRNHAPIFPGYVRDPSSMERSVTDTDVSDADNIPND